MFNANKISKTRKVARDGVFKAELDQFFQKELAGDGYSGVEVRAAPNRYEIIISITKTQSVLGEKGRRVKELTAVLQKRFNLSEKEIDIYCEKMMNRGLSAVAQAESLRYKLLGGVAVRKACYDVLQFIIGNYFENILNNITPPAMFDKVNVRLFHAKRVAQSCLAKSI